jgi:hypothetical protein
MDATGQIGLKVELFVWSGNLYAESPSNNQAEEALISIARYSTYASVAITKVCDLSNVATTK